MIVEYSLLTWVLVVGLILGATVRIIPGPREQQSLVELFSDAYRVYGDSFHFVLSLPFP